MKKTILFVLFVGIIIFISGCVDNKIINNTIDTVPTPIIMDTNEPVAIAQPTTPQDALVAFFDYLVNNEFGKAAQLYGASEADWESLAAYSSLEDQKNKSRVLENYCRNTQTCLKVKILQTKKATGNIFNMTVQFLNNDGSIYVFGPCCGATEVEMPSKNTFDYQVVKVDNSYKVITPPLYRP